MTKALDEVGWQNLPLDWHTLPLQTLQPINTFSAPSVMIDPFWIGDIEALSNSFGSGSRLVAAHSFKPHSVSATFAGGEMQSDSLAFFRAWVARPFQIAAIVPLGRALAEIITREITPQTGHVIELGPGTGVFTTKMIERGVRPQHLTLVEYSQEFVERLKGRFPGARVLSMDAARLQDLKFPPETSVGAVVSGLPLLTMPAGKVMEILEGAFRHLRPGGAFYQFTYMSKCPVPQSVLDHLDLNATQVDRTFRNLPPAPVYRITTRRPGK